MKISVASGKGISNRRLLLATNSYFNNDGSRRIKHVIPVEEYGMIVQVQPYRVSFNVYNRTKNYEEIIEKYLTSVFEGKTIGILMPADCKLTTKVPKVNICQL